MGAKGGPSTTLGSPDDHHGISAPYDSDLQTQITAKAGDKKNKRERKVEGDNEDSSGENNQDNP